MTTVVWFKRDLRIHDHGPLASVGDDPVVPLFIVEPEYWLQPDTSARQWQFIGESLTELDQRLGRLGARLLVRRGDVVEVLRQLRRQLGVFRLVSHEETGNDWTFQRDRRVAGWCGENGIQWQQWSQFGVVRGPHDRDRWDRAWRSVMEANLLPEPARLNPALPQTAPDLTPPRCADVRPCPGRQTGGTQQAESLLSSFLRQRSIGYQYRISSPLTAWDASSRLSPYLAVGALSLRRLYQETRAMGESGRTLPRKSKSLRSFRSRLHWHCHFIQKLEDEPELEFRAIHRDLEGLREPGFRPDWLERWQQGMTGWPLVDACMRALHHSGWINFRMRAMLMAVASYHLHQHWREPALHLARLFTDYEPGIHYPQAQMQSGLTGINAFRIYNPVLQSQKLDPKGAFIRRWVPELVNVPVGWVHTPWLLSPSERGRHGADGYPLPVIDHEEASRRARAHLKAYRSAHVTRAETERVLAQHGSRATRQRRSKTFDSSREAGVKGKGNDPQLSLFS